MSILAPIILNSNIRADQLNVKDYEMWGIAPATIEYYRIYNGAEDTQMIVNLSALEFEGWSTPYPNITLQVFSWDDYYHEKLLGIANNATQHADNYKASIEFFCELGEEYLVRIVNLDIDDYATYNISFVTEEGVSIPASNYNELEIMKSDGDISVSFYETTDPWLYDNYPSSDRLVLQLGYYVYGEFSYIRASGERYFLIKNRYADIDLFVGMTYYDLNPSRDYPTGTLTVTDWQDLEAGRTKTIGTTHIILNYSCSINFTCKVGHTYQIWMKNGDSAYAIFANITFWTHNQSKIRFDWDLSITEPLDDEIIVRGFIYDPWLDYKRTQRETLWGWIIGSVGVAGVCFGCFWIKARYL